jgi:hypothetical protein
MSLPGHRVPADIVLDPDKPVVDPADGEVRSDTGQLGRNWKRRYGWVDSPRTKAVYGFVGAAGTIALDGVEFTIDTDFATVAISSLTDEPIAESTSMLLTAVGRADNTGARYDQTHAWQLDIGHPPIEVDVIEGEIRLTTTRRDLRVWMIGEVGQVLGWMPVRHVEGQLRFRIGFLPSKNKAEFQLVDTASIYYLIRVS